MTTATMRWILSGILGLALMVSVAAPAKGAEALMEIDKLEALAEKADSAKDHAEVAKHYRLRAEHFIEQAKRHESEVARLNKKLHGAMAHKWPAMTRGAVDREKQLAMQARRAASENMAIAEKHVQLAVEKQLTD
jgi:hypothetical protein